MHNHSLNDHNTLAGFKVYDFTKRWLISCKYSIKKTPGKGIDLTVRGIFAYIPKKLYK